MAIEPSPSMAETGARATNRTPATPNLACAALPDKHREPTL